MAALALPIRPDQPCIDVQCAGTPREAGLAQGRVLREQIRGCAAAIYELEALQLQRPWWLPSPAFVRVAEGRAGRALRSGVSVDLPSAMERLHAMSIASGVPLRRLALINALEPVLSDLSGTVATGVEAGCSAIAVSAERTGGRGAILAHNFDYLPLVQPFYVVRDERPRGGLRSLQFSAAPLAGAIDGINAAGLAVTLNYAFTTDIGRPAPTLTMRLAEVLAGCQTVEEAVAWLTAHSRWGSGLVMLADAAGARASLELSPTRHAVRQGESAGILAHANQFRAPITSAVQIADDAVHGPRSPTPLRGRPVHRSSKCRVACLEQSENLPPLLDATAIAQLMSGHGPMGVPSADSVCMHSDYWFTTACIQLLPRDRTLRIAYSPACCAQYTEMALQ